MAVKLTEHRKIILTSIGCYYGFKILAKCVRKYLTFRKHAKFVDKYGTDRSVGHLGLIPKFAELKENDEAYLDYRLGQIKTIGANNAELLPPYYMFVISEPKLAKFM